MLVFSKNAVNYNQITTNSYKCGQAVECPKWGYLTTGDGGAWIAIGTSELGFGEEGASAITLNGC